jgi:MFS family permease
MWLVARSIRPTPQNHSTQSVLESQSVKNAQAGNKSQKENERAFSWFLIALIIAVLGVASTSQVFPLFLMLNEGLHATDLEVSFILSAWTLGGMLASVIAGRMADVTQRTSVMLVGLVIAAATPLSYGLVPNVVGMGIVYGVNGIAFMTIQTAGFALAGDIIPEDRRGRLLSRYNTVMALSWGPAGLLIGGPLADIQTGILNVPKHAAYVNAFLVSSLLVLLGTFVFFVRVRRQK